MRFGWLRQGSLEEKPAARTTGMSETQNQRREHPGMGLHSLVAASCPAVLNGAPSSRVSPELTDWL